ncbi:hypothetical protein DAC15_40 [Bacteroides phage DAC15]|uniref:hypothetical protein n=1 Tax=Bacteroides phage DAC15 TaxID=2710495 RepID=UPI001BEA28CF|nr:hypothetical protein KNU90_gp099 [Bacteroides phage DAC15]QIN96219.1 hypothetical protein DAC15_40 [Bacteroides phage DAC15]QIN96337.1 hypothetical protein DAC17_38 [Bacteroides phage DAC17]
MLSDILARFNFLYLVYDGDASNTRLQVEAQYRRKGLWIAYVRTDGTLITEYSTSDNIDDETWSSDANWDSATTAVIDIKSLEPEDLTLELEKITFANRAYNPSTYSGMGYTILRKNIQTVPSVGTVNLLTQDMISNPNTVYEIRYDFNLNGATINIPEGSVLDFKGGSLGNGTIIGSTTKLNLKSGYLINLNLSGSYDIEYISYRYFKNYLDDTTLVAAMFDLLFNNISKSTLDLEPDRLYNIYSETLVGYATSIYEYTNVSDKRINGNSAVFNDLRTRAQMGTTRYDGILGLNNSHNIQILYLNYQNLNEDYDLPTQIGYIGSSFILLNSDCSNIEVVSNIIGARSVTVEQLGVPFSIDLGLTSTQHDSVISPFMGGLAFNRSSELIGSYIRQEGTIYVPSDDGDLTNASITLFPRVLILSSLVVDGRDMVEIEYILQRSNGSIVYENLTSLPKSGTTGSYSAYQNSSLDPLYIDDGITLGVTFYLTDASTEEKTVLKTYKLYIYK